MNEKNRKEKKRKERKKQKQKPTAALKYTGIIG